MWLTADLSGTPAEAGPTIGHKIGLRRQVHAMLVEEGWADRVNIKATIDDARAAYEAFLDGAPLPSREGG